MKEETELVRARLAAEEGRSVEEMRAQIREGLLDRVPHHTRQSVWHTQDSRLAAEEGKSVEEMRAQIREGLLERVQHLP